MLNTKSNKFLGTVADVGEAGIGITIGLIILASRGIFVLVKAGVNGVKSLH